MILEEYPEQTFCPITGHIAQKKSSGSGEKYGVHLLKPAVDKGEKYHIPKNSLYEVNGQKIHTR